ncbi:hypothetical protein C8F04DRAFT_1265749 [Mycena alexandri]|uniref:Uncharacterized protein n=1 Tax=Mycena alexandri TaxID=1745969 RepID=A0AAD6WV97_9AGAR|nr:hypothetical protein C8F04DRAFT_1265749 [Mycena alexandri]
MEEGRFLWRLWRLWRSMGVYGTVLVFPDVSPYPHRSSSFPSPIPPYPRPLLDALRRPPASAILTSHEDLNVVLAMSWTPPSTRCYAVGHGPWHITGLTTTCSSLCAARVGGFRRGTRISGACCPLLTPLSPSSFSFDHVLNQIPFLPSHLTSLARRLRYQADPSRPINAVIPALFSLPPTARSNAHHPNPAQPQHPSASHPAVMPAHTRTASRHADINQSLPHDASCSLFGDATKFRKYFDISAALVFAFSSLPSVRCYCSRARSVARHSTRSPPVRLDICSARSRASGGFPFATYPTQTTFRGYSSDYQG